MTNTLFEFPIAATKDVVDLSDVVGDDSSQYIIPKVIDGGFFIPDTPDGREIAKELTKIIPDHQQIEFFGVT